MFDVHALSQRCSVGELARTEGRGSSGRGDGNHDDWGGLLDPFWEQPAADELFAVEDISCIDAHEHPDGRIIVVAGTLNGCLSLWA